MKDLVNNVNNLVFLKSITSSNQLLLGGVGLFRFQFQKDLLTSNYKIISLEPGKTGN